VGFIDKIKTAVGRDPYDDRSRGDNSLYPDDYDDYADDDYVDDGYQDDGYADDGYAEDGYRGNAVSNNRGYSTRGYGRPGRGGLSDADGYDYDDPSRTRYDAYRRPEPAYQEEQPEEEQPPAGITYRKSSSADSVHVLQREDANSRFNAHRNGKEETAPTGEMRIVRANRYEDIEVVSRYFCAGDTVALVLTNVSHEIGRRILDFSFGVVSALGGKVDHAYGSVFVLTHDVNGLSDKDRETLRAQGLIE